MPTCGRPGAGDPRVGRRECKGNYETTAFQGWRLCIARGGVSFVRHFSDKEYGGQRKALKAAESKLAEMKAFPDSAPRQQGKLTKTAEAKARKMLKAD